MTDVLKDLSDGDLISIYEEITEYESPGFSQYNANTVYIVANVEKGHLYCIKHKEYYIIKGSLLYLMNGSKVKVKEIKHITGVVVKK